MQNNFDIKKWQEKNYNTYPEILNPAPPLPILKTLHDPAITIISPSFNTGKFLEDTIKSIVRQTYQNWEHIIVDAGSTDETLEILKKYPHVRYISEFDSGVPEAMCKGLAMAKGEFIFSCCISDGYLDPEWFEKCIQVMKHDNDVSLVWGFPQNMTEKGRLQNVAYPQFHEQKPPQKQNFIFYWLKTCFWLPEGNFCVRRKIFAECLPEWPYQLEKDYDVWLEFNYHFHRKGYLPYFINSAANFGRIHSRQITERETEEGISEIRIQNYFKKVKNYRKKLSQKKVVHSFFSGTDVPLGRLTINKEFILKTMPPSIMNAFFLKPVHKIIHFFQLLMQKINSS